MDRARWRRSLRSRPRLRGAYRFVVGVVGVSIMLLAISIGWLPGPGGVPLFLVGLAVLATEFVWASKVLFHANHTVRRFATWSARQPRWVRGAMVAALVVAILLAMWFALAIVGVPGWTPAWLANGLALLPLVG